MGGKGHSHDHSLGLQSCLRQALGGLACASTRPPLPSAAPRVFPRGHPLLLAWALATCLAGEEEEEGWEGEGRPGQVTTGTGGGEVEGLVGGAEALPLPLPPTREMTTRGRQLPMLRPAGGDRVAQATSLREPLKRERALKTV